MILIGGKAYELITDHKSGWNQEVFRERYSEVLDRYDYIVGDWGYNQMRLRGFFKENSPKATKESTIAILQDYLNEYCNFGCAYFVIERVPGKNADDDEGASFADEASLREETTAAQEDMPKYTIRSQPAAERAPRAQANAAQSDRTAQGGAGQQERGPSGGGRGAQQRSGQQGQHGRAQGQGGRPQGQQGARPQGAPREQGQQQGGQRPNGGPPTGQGNGQSQSHGQHRAHVSAHSPQGQSQGQGQGQGSQSQGPQGNQQHQGQQHHPRQQQNQRQHGHRPHGYNNSNGHRSSPNKQQAAPNGASRDQ